MRDFRRLQNDPPSGVTGAPMDNNILAWQVNWQILGKKNGQNLNFVTAAADPLIVCLIRRDRHHVSIRRFFRLCHLSKQF